MRRWLVLGWLAWALAAGAAWAHPPRGIVVDARGQVYFTDLRQIWKVDAAGRLHSVRAPGERHTHELAIDAAGAVHGEDSMYDPGTGAYSAALWRIGPDGRFSYLLPPTPAPLPLGSSVWRDAAGQSYLPDRTLHSHHPFLVRRGSNGRTDVLWGDPAHARRHRQELAAALGGAGFGPDGAFYFRHGSTLRRYSPALGVQAVASDLPADNFGIAPLPDGGVLVADFAGRRVLKVGPGAARAVSLKAEAPWAPTGVAARNGSVYVLESRQDPRGAPVGLRVRRLGPEGRVTLLATVPVR